MAAAKLVGTDGWVYALDIHPLAVSSVKRRAARKSVGNVRTIMGGNIDEVGNESIDIVLLYDVLHEIKELAPILSEIDRVLKPHGTVSVGDHRLQEQTIVRMLTEKTPFRLLNRKRWTVQFQHTGKNGVKQ